MGKLTERQADLIGILRRLGGEATTRQISEASGRNAGNWGPRISVNGASQSLSSLSGYVKYCGMAGKGDARWKLIREPEIRPTKTAQGGLDFDAPEGAR